MLNVSVSLYPQETKDSDEIIKRSIDALKDNVEAVRVGPVDSEFSADPDTAWQALREMYEEAEASGREVSMEVTLTNTRP